MGRARGNTPAVAVADPFSAVMGRRRGLAPIDLGSVYAALSEGDPLPALALVAAGRADQKLLAKTAAAVAIPAREGAYRRLRDCEDFLRAAPAEAPFWESVAETKDAVGVARMMAAPRPDESAKELQARCAEAVGARVYLQAAAFLRDGGPARMQKVLGRKQWSWTRRRVAAATDIHPKSGMLAQLLVRATDEHVVKALCEDGGAVMATDPLIRSAVELRKAG